MPLPLKKLRIRFLAGYQVSGSSIPLDQPGSQTSTRNQLSLEVAHTSHQTFLLPRASDFGGRLRGRHLGLVESASVALNLGKSRMLNQIARERGITRSEAIEQLVREEIARREKLPA